MSKHLLEDMVKTKHINKEIKREFLQRNIKETEIKKVGRVEEITRDIGIDKTKSSRYYLWFVAFISVAFLIFALSFLFGRAEVVVSPKIQGVILNENLSANKDSNTAGLPFDLVIISGEENKNVQATEEKDVRELATGTVVFFNAFSFSSQILSIDTRLEGSNGKIYKTQNKIMVPGMNKDGTPGQMEVGIYGVEVGAEYNSAPLDFKIFGFKGTPRYSKIIGRSKTGTVISGGFKGKSPVLSDVIKTNTIAELTENLKIKLLKKVITPNFILFQNASFLKIDEESIPFNSTQSGDVSVKIKGTLYGILFNEQKLTKKIAQDNIEKYDGSDVYIPNIKDLIFALSNKDNVSFDNLQNIDFNLSGSAKIVWKFDVDKFIPNLLGKTKKDFNQILSQYPNIDSATLTLSPFWKMSIPDKAKNIKVIVNYPK